MHNSFQEGRFSLQLFADGAAVTPEGVGQRSALSAENQSRTGSSRRSMTGAAQQAAQAAAGAQQSSPDAGENQSPEDKRKAFRALVEGAYKEQYTELFQNAFNRRFREVKAMEGRLAAQQAVLDLLSQRYNVPEGDLAQLRSAVERDEEAWQAAANKAGMSLEQYRQFVRLREDSRQLQQLRQQHRAQAQMHRWLREAGEARHRYPAFDLRAELADGNFRSLLRSGVSVGQAYELRHMEEIKADAARQAARSAGEQMAARIRSSQLRPRENGISDQSAVITKSDVYSLTPAQRREIARRVQKGDRIRF